MDYALEFVFSAGTAMILAWAAVSVRHMIFRKRRAASLSWGTNTALSDQAAISRKYFLRHNISARFPMNKGAHDLDVSEGATYILMAFRNDEFRPTASFIRDLESEQLGKRGKGVVVIVDAGKLDPAMMKLSYEKQIAVIVPKQLQDLREIIEGQPSNLRNRVLEISQFHNVTYH